MGNYQEYLKMMPSPLREIDPDQPKRLHTFGNPFKQDKKVKKNLKKTRPWRTCSTATGVQCLSSFHVFPASGHDDRRSRRVCGRPSKQEKRKLR